MREEVVAAQESAPDANEDRRGAVRFPVDMRAMFVLSPGCTSVRQARVRNLSVTGACLVSGSNLEPGTELSVGFYLRGEDPLVTIARVVWSRPGADGTAVGIAFDSAVTQRPAFVRLGKYLRSREARGA
jgi:hypothetical protein